MLMIRDLHVRQLNHILKVNEDLRASNERMRVVLATLQSEVMTDLVKDLMVVAGKLSSSLLKLSPAILLRQARSGELALASLLRRSGFRELAPVS